MAKFAVILSGCGVFDGSEIHEATLTLLALARYSVEYDIYAPDIDQHHVLNHITGEEMSEKRNVLVEAARIARGNISDLKDLDIKGYDGVVFPGGFGVAKNLCTYAFSGTDMDVLPAIEDVVKKAYEEKIPIGGICISPVLIAKVIAKGMMTVGNSDETGSHLETMGAEYSPQDSVDICVDEENKIVTAPAYMNDASILEVSVGIEKLVKAMISLQ
jgi:enhancing lycopene biosynthesis protein 2